VKGAIINDPSSVVRIKFHLQDHSENSTKPLAGTVLNLGAVPPPHVFAVRQE
jgi:hypothetical protein